MSPSSVMNFSAVVISQFCNLPDGNHGILPLSQNSGLSVEGVPPAIVRATYLTLVN
jgi:hypothetical protein